MSKSRVLTDTQIAEICTRYLSGDSCNLLAKVYQVDASTISYWLKKEGSVLRGGSERSQKYKINQYFFDKIDTEEKAYWLGFIYADGCVYKNTLQINLAIKDEEQLLRFRESLGSTHPIFYQTDDKNSRKCRLVIGNKRLVASLAKLGCIPRKTHVLTFPTSDMVPYGFVFHFIRGYFDGDGSVCFTKRNHGQVSFAGTFDMLDKIDGFLSVRDSSTIRDTGGCWTSTYAGSGLTERIYDLLYPNATIFLSRKKETFEKAISQRPKNRFPLRCSVRGCMNIHKAHGYCATHYARWWRNKDKDYYVVLEPAAPYKAVA